MKKQEIRFNNQNKKYSIIIGNNVLGVLPNKIRALCPSSKKIALIFDYKVPKKFKTILSRKLRKYDLTILTFKSNEKTKSFNSVNFFLNKLLSNRTSVIIAHRLSTIRDANQIAVLDQGNIIELGNHKKLIETNGKYAEMYQSSDSLAA